ncbi:MULTISPECIES: protein translocase subunit SecD [unclassified Oceanispirochaeta]|uniref:protein translocase subunit SecD n=1 Tax=unclassified Oceanispirochaeta TaxID=2635722 RepID=UPI000E08FD9C|nr:MULTISPECIES: protein translocase subunit SecD [unclassified Oceanispirochaeta]MBF9015614.1 protein translocase subunit SecD [Oceanispirochaeta sp. M2]NPD73388.1 protein translocase subunit SecD [Oceanispirochaeta sp. M1]RDG30862.1 protein translocase subunit SecD [Oceanispirochaeta sp. M1]
MNKRLRFIVVLFFLGLGAFFLYPTVQWYFNTPEEKKTLANGSKEQIRNYAKIEASEDLDTLVELVKDSPEADFPANIDFLVSVAKDNYKLEKRDMPDSWTVQSVLAGFQSGTEVYSALEDYYRDDILSLKELKNKTLMLGLDLSGGMSVVVEANMDSLEERLERKPTEEDMKEALTLAMEILNNRIDKFGVTEPQIRKQSNNQILIEIPGEVDPERVNSFLMGKGNLNFHIVDDAATSRIAQYALQNPSETFENGRPSDNSILEAGLLVYGHYKKDSYGIDQFQRYVVISEEIGLDGQHIEQANVIADQVTGQPNVIFNLDSEGGEIFYKFTSDNTNNTLAVVMDDKVKAAARISEPIRNSVRITGFDSDEANDLALVLRTAALPVELEVTNETAVGASLGNDAIDAGLKSILFGFIGVFVFMIIYYKGAGLIADLALVLNLVFIVAILSSFNMTLTMTSIAGLILTVGMAVDANVIIFERIKEELRVGKSRSAAVEAGFKKAFWTVMDANITTFIAAIFLSQLGKGPIQGFAITLAVGIVCSLFTAIFVSRLVFDFGSDVLKKDKMSIAWGLK